MKIIGIDSYIVTRKKKMRIGEKKILFSELAEDVVLGLRSEENGTAYTSEQAADLADYILYTASDIEGGAATPIVRIINGFGIDIRRTKHMMDGISGVIYVGGRTKEVYNSDKVIFTDDKEPFEHQRFVMAHELAHYLFDYEGNPKRREAGCTFAETYPRKDHNSRRERRANRFAAELLMPKKYFIEQYNHAIDESGNYLYTVKYLARYFQVKETSVKKRIYEVLYDGGY